jgi:hypothetical protein
MPNTKPSAGGSLLAFGPKKPEESADEDLGLTSAANAVFTALKADDRAGFASALHSYVKQCQGADDLAGADEPEEL